MTEHFAKPTRKPDFEDCFTGPNANPNKSAFELAEIAVSNYPTWFGVLFNIRQKLAKLVGLKSDINGEAVQGGTTFLLHLPVVENSENKYEGGYIRQAS